MPSSLPVKKKPASPAKKQAGPLKKQAGPLKKPAGPLKKQAGPAKKQAGPAKKQAGPAKKQAGPAKKQAGPAKKQAGPLKKQAGPLKKQAGPAKKQAGSAKKQAGPAKKQTRNCFGHGDLNGTQQIARYRNGTDNDLLIQSAMNRLDKLLTQIRGYMLQSWSRLSFLSETDLAPFTTQQKHTEKEEEARDTRERLVQGFLDHLSYPGYQIRTNELEGFNQSNFYTFMITQSHTLFELTVYNEMGTMYQFRVKRISFNILSGKKEYKKIDSIPPEMISQEFLDKIYVLKDTWLGTKIVYVTSLEEIKASLNEFFDYFNKSILSTDKPEKKAPLFLGMDG